MNHYSEALTQVMKAALDSGTPITYSKAKKLARLLAHRSWSISELATAATTETDHGTPTAPLQPKSTATSDPTGNRAASRVDAQAARKLNNKNARRRIATRDK